MTTFVGRNFILICKTHVNDEGILKNFIIDVISYKQ